MAQWRGIGSSVAAPGWVRASALPRMPPRSGLRRLCATACLGHRGKPIATLCHGPWPLASAGLTTGRRMTSWPGVRDDMVNAGATWMDQAVVRDANWLTSRGPQDMSHRPLHGASAG